MTHDERIDWFIEDDVVRETGALCAFHYLFARYRKWRARYGLLKTGFSQLAFAYGISCDVTTDFDRELFLGIYTRREEVRFSLEKFLRLWRPEYAAHCERNFNPEPSRVLNQKEDYSEAQIALEEAQDVVLMAREDLKTIFESLWTNGTTSEEIDETLGKYGLSCDEISTWE